MLRGFLKPLATSLYVQPLAATGAGYDTARVFGQPEPSRLPSMLGINCAVAEAAQTATSADRRDMAVNGGPDDDRK